MDTFTLFVTSTAPFDPTGPTAITKVTVLASTTNDAELCALQMVAARGRCPVAVDVDFDNF